MPLHPLPALVRHWPEAWRDEWAERAAIIEYDDRRPREQAERLAEAIVRARYERLRAEGRGEG